MRVDTLGVDIVQNLEETYGHLDLYLFQLLVRSHLLGRLPSLAAIPR
jgi:hypothetical protein